MIINKKLIHYLEQKNVNVHDALLYLLGVYHDLNTNSLPELTKKEINVLEIVERDIENNDIIWKIPLFEGQEIKWAWVKEYRELFRSIRPNVGNLNSCITTMKKFFAENPETRKEDVLKAAEFYLKTFKLGSEPSTMMQRADYFIYKGKKHERTSRLEEYLEIVEDQKEETNTRYNIQ